MSFENYVDVGFRFEGVGCGGCGDTLADQFSNGGETSFLHMLFDFLRRLKDIGYTSDQGVHPLQVTAAAVHNHEMIWKWDGMVQRR